MTAHGSVAEHILSCDRGQLITQVQSTDAENM
jgi:hypothetical protein